MKTIEQEEAKISELKVIGELHVEL